MRPYAWEFVLLFKIKSDQMYLSFLEVLPLYFEMLAFRGERVA